jgi:hypothetical protein
LSIASVLTLSVVTFACSPTVQWEAKVAPDFTPSGHAVSVFGVYKDGQMSSEAWSGLRPRLAPVLGRPDCAIALGDPLADEPLFKAIEEYARTNGPTDDLLAQLASAAEGDLILVLVEAGGLPVQEEKTSVVNTPAGSAPSPTGSKGTAGFAAFTPRKRPGGEDRSVLQLSASLFSIAQRRSVAFIDMQYSGDSIDEAETAFAARVGRLLPATVCKGWDWHHGVDPERIRKLAAE